MTSDPNEVTAQILEILKKLVSFKSITPDSGGAIEYIARLLANYGFNCDIQVFGEKKSGKTTNLYARYGTESPNLCFAGHVDVVPPLAENLWKYDPFVLTARGNRLYGRGTVDMKGAIACALSAVLQYLEKHRSLKGSISFLLTSDEEGKATYGTGLMLEYLKHKGEKMDFAILGEPTTKKVLGDTIKIGRRGSINFALKVEGKQGHTAYPELAVNPVNSLIRLATVLLNTEFDNGSRFFEKTNLVITSIDVGNKVTNIIPKTASMMFNVRFNDLHSSESVIEKVTQIITAHERMFDLKCDTVCEPFIQEYTDKMKEFAKLVQQECGIVPSIETGGGTSDARFIHHHCKVVEFGLYSDQAHKINEYTQINDLQTLYKVYYSFLPIFFIR